MSTREGQNEILQPSLHYQKHYEIDAIIDIPELSMKGNIYSNIRHS